MDIKGKISPAGILNGRLSIPTGAASAPEYFDGDYLYTPTFESQVIPIEGLVAREDIIIDRAYEREVHFQGTFVTPSSRGTYMVETGYTGDGYPLAAAIIAETDYPEDVTDFYNTEVMSNNVALWAMIKDDKSTAPSFESADAAENRGVACAVYRGNSISSYNVVLKTDAVPFYIMGPNAEPSACVRFASNRDFTYFVDTMEGKGLCPNTAYKYIIAYSE